MSSGIKYYLAIYNGVALSLWLAYFISFSTTGFQLTFTNLILLDMAQGIAILEVVHAALGWVRSPITSTAAQVASRVLVVILINLFWQVNDYPTFHAGLVIVSIAWTITELGRYSLYGLSLFDNQSQWLLWMRYSFFIVLYPMGVTGEWLIIGAPIIAHGFHLDIYTGFVLILFIAYAYYFPVLYGYMWKQRRAKLS